MKLKQLIAALNRAKLLTDNPNPNILIANDEEWNTLFTKPDIGINIDDKTEEESLVIFGLSGSEQPD